MIWHPFNTFARRLIPGVPGYQLVAQVLTRDTPGYRNNEDRTKDWERIRNNQQGVIHIPQSGYMRITKGLFNMSS
jgi:hypothetical protein